MADLWTNYKELLCTVTCCVSRADKDACSKLKEVLPLYKEALLNVLTLPKQDTRSRNIVSTAVINGIDVPHLKLPPLSSDITDEILTLSDSLHINELVAAKLYTLATEQVPYYPDFSKKQIASILYLDGQKALAETIKAIMNSRSGIRWQFKRDGPVAEYLACFSDELVQAGLLERTFDLIRNLGDVNEMAIRPELLLAEQSGFNSEIRSFVKEIRQIFADIIFSYAAQNGLHLTYLNTLVTFLQSKEEDEINDIIITLHMSCFFTIDVSVISEYEDDEDVLDVPAPLEETTLECVLWDLLTEETKWASAGLEAVTSLFLSVTLYKLKKIPGWMRKGQEELLTVALDNDVFGFMYHKYLQFDIIRANELYAERFHILIADFIMVLPLKVDELRETTISLRKLGFTFTEEDPFSSKKIIGRQFEFLLLSFTHLHDDRLQHVKFHLNYWGGKTAPNPEYCEVLQKFLQKTGDALPQQMFITYLKFIDSLIQCSKSANCAFTYFKSNVVQMLTWKYFFELFQKLVEEEFEPSRSTGMSSAPMEPINPAQQQEFETVLSVMRHVAEHSETSRVALCENKEWKAIETFVTLIHRSDDVIFKEQIILTLSALCKPVDPSQMVLHYKMEEFSQKTFRGLYDLFTSDSEYNFEYVFEFLEAKHERYPCTKAVLKLLDALTDNWDYSLSSLNKLDPCLSYIMQSVFVRGDTHFYKERNEQFEMADLSSKLLLKFLRWYRPDRRHFEPKITLTYTPLFGCHVMIALFSDGELFKILMETIRKGYTYTRRPNSREAQTYKSLTLTCLLIVERALVLQQAFFKALKTAESGFRPVRITSLLQKIDRGSKVMLNMLIIIRYLNYSRLWPHHATVALRILCLMISRKSFKHDLLLSSVEATLMDANVLHGFVQCLERNHVDWKADEGVGLNLKLEAIRLLSLCLKIRFPNIGYFVLGFSKRDGGGILHISPEQLGAERSPLHSLTRMLSKSLLSRRNQMVKIHQSLVLVIYKFFRYLCLNALISAPVLRCLRQIDNTLQQQLLSLPFQLYDTGVELECSSFLFDVAAIELIMLVKEEEFFKAKELCSVLLSHSALKEFSMATLATLVADQKSLLQNIDISAAADTRLCYLFKCIPFNESEPKIPVLKCFVTLEMISLMRSVKDSTELQLIDVDQLRLKIVQDVVPRVKRQIEFSLLPTMQQEIGTICSYAALLNRHRQLRHYVLPYVNRWRKIVITTCTETPDNVIPFIIKISLEMELIQTILKTYSHRLVQLHNIPDLLSETVAVLIMDAKECYRRQHKDKSQLRIFIYKFRDHVKTTLRYLNQWIIYTKKSSIVRKNLYIVLTTYYDFYTTFLNETVEDKRDFRCIREKTNTELILKKSLNMKLIKNLSNDALNVGDVCEVAALNCLSAILKIAPNWISHVCEAPRLERLRGNIVLSEEQLKCTELDKSLEIFQVFFARMSFLQIVASHSGGVKLILQQNVLSSLMGMSSMRDHPQVSPKSEENVYTVIVISVMKLCKLIVLSANKEEEDKVLFEMARLLLRSEKLVSLLLMELTPVQPTSKLFVELIHYITYLTSVVSCKDFADTHPLMDNFVTRDEIAYMRKRVSLVPSRMDINVQELCRIAESGLAEDCELIVQYTSTLLNCLHYVRKVTNDSMNGNRLERPVLDISTIPSFEKRVHPGRMTLGDIMKCIRQAVEYYHFQLRSIDRLNVTAERMFMMTITEIAITMGIPVTVAAEYKEKRWNDIGLVLKEKTLQKQKILDICYSITKIGIFVLHAHINYYLHKIMGTRVTTREQEQSSSLDLNSLTSTVSSVSNSLTSTVSSESNSLTSTVSSESNSLTSTVSSESNSLTSTVSSVSNETVVNPCDMVEDEWRTLIPELSVLCSSVSEQFSGEYIKNIRTMAYNKSFTDGFYVSGLIRHMKELILKTRAYFLDQLREI